MVRDYVRHQNLHHVKHELFATLLMHLALKEQQIHLRRWANYFQAASQKEPVADHHRVPALVLHGPSPGAGEPNQEPGPEHLQE